MAIRPDDVQPEHPLMVASRDDFAAGDHIVVRSYPGRNQSDAAQMFGVDARLAATYGYRPIAQSWGEGRPGIGRVLLISEWAGLLRPKGFLTVTYRMDAVAKSSVRKCPDCAETIKAEANVCRFCGYRFANPVPQHDTPDG